MADTNILIVSGRITSDPQNGSTPKGTPYSTFSLALNEFTNGEKKTTFVDIRAFSSTATYVSQYLSKGRRVLVEGRIRQDSWQDKNTGAKRSKTYIAAASIQALDYVPQPSPNTENAPQLANEDYPF